MRVTQAKDGVDLEERADGLPATAYYRLAENWMVRPMAVGHARANSVFPRSRLPVFRLAVCVVLRVGDSYLLTKRVGGASFPYIWVWPGGHVDVRKVFLARLKRALLLRMTSCFTRTRGV